MAKPAVPQQSQPAPVMAQPQKTSLAGLSPNPPKNP